MEGILIVGGDGRRFGDGHVSKLALLSWRSIRIQSGAVSTVMAKFWMTPGPSLTF
jgi:hypothetical protein